MASRTLTSVVLAAFLLASGSAAPTEATPLAGDAALEARTMEVAQGLRCLVCQNESIAASQSELAVDLRGQVRKMLAQDKSPDEVRDYMVARYGEFVLMKPRLSPTTLLLWVGPFAILGAVLAGVAMAIRRRRNEPGVAPLDEAERRRAVRLLRQGSENA